MVYKTNIIYWSELNHKLNIQRDTVEERKVSKPIVLPALLLCVGNKTKFLSSPLQYLFTELILKNIIDYVCIYNNNNNKINSTTNTACISLKTIFGISTEMKI